MARTSTARLGRSVAHEAALAPLAAPAIRGRRTVTTAPSVTDELSKKVIHLIDEIRKPFAAFVNDFAAMTESRAELAPKFMKAFAAYAQETGKSFVAFVRVIDPSVPEDRDGYRGHSTYQAATYLKRLVDQQGAQREASKVPASERPATPLVALARFVTTVLPLVDPTGALWNAFIKEMKWTDEYAERVKVLGAKQGPIVLKGRAVAAFRVARTGTEG